MQGNIVAAARWLGASVVLASVILVAGMRWARSADAGRPADPVQTRPAGVETPARAQESPAAPASDAKPAAAGVVVSVAGSNVPIFDPVADASSLPNCLDPPSEDEVWEKVPRFKNGSPVFYETERNNARFLTEKIGDKVDPCRIYPLAGPCQLHHCHYKCTIYFQELYWSDYPIPFNHIDNRVEVVYIDKDYLTRCGGCGADPKSPH
ncbi:MAG TPA: hypothetical protein VG406_11975 [Isosphaeraceae bacterium]|nr:hypothetical protein [Isosphaeraceae bacterium]